MSELLLEVRNLSCSLDGETTLLRDVNFTVREGDILVLQGKSGCGKSTLLKCLAHLNLYEGAVIFRGRTPKEQGVPRYRTHVLYVPQRPSLLPGSPRDFIEQLNTFGSHKSREREEHHRQQHHCHHLNGDTQPDITNADTNNNPDTDADTNITGTNDDTKGDDLAERAIAIASSWGVGEVMWNRPWATLSGGEAQRISLSIAVGLDSAEILLLDEPTSALDAETSSRVEKHLRKLVSTPNARPKALVWITHSGEQGQRIGTRFIEVSDGSCKEMLVPDASV